MNPSWIPSDARPLATSLLACLLCACALHRAPSFETAKSPKDEPRRPDGVAVDLQGSLPEAQPVGSTDEGLLPLKEPVDPSLALHAIRRFFRAVSNEDLDNLVEGVAADAQQLPLGSGSGMPVERHWDRRFRKFDYAAGVELPYRESTVETYRFEDLDGSLPNRPLRPAGMTPQDVLVRVPIARTHFGLDRVFGEEMLFVLRWQGSQFEIQTVYEDFVAP